MINETDIAAMLEDDARILDEVERRVKMGAVKEREATRDEWFSVLRMAIFYRDACEDMVRRMIGQGSESMSMHEGPAKLSEM